MKCIINFSEIQSFVKLKYGRELILTTIDEKTVKIETKVSAKVPLLGEVSKNIGVQVVVERVEGQDVYLFHKGGLGVDMLISGGMTFLASDSTRNIVDKIPNNGIVIHLDEILAIHKVLDKIELKAISFDEQNVNVDCLLKLDRIA